MKHSKKLVVIGFISGCILATFLLLVNMVTDNKAYILLFNVDYIPLLRNIWSQPGIGIVFHFVFSILSVVGLYYILHLLHWEQKVMTYVAVYTVGSALLFYLTALSSKPPVADDHIAWLYWTCAHVLFGISVGLFVKRWT